MTNQNEDSPRQISDRVRGHLKYVDWLQFSNEDLIDLFWGLFHLVDSRLKANSQSKAESTPDDPEPFHGDGFDRYVENLIQDIQDEQENSVDDLA